MNCITCGGETRVDETILSKGIIYRKRKCTNCNQRFFTKEMPVKDEECKQLFTEWSRERSRKSRAKAKGIEYEPTFSDGREKKVEPKMPTRRLF